jgi:hypothetical protein
MYITFPLAGAWIAFFCVCAWASRYGVSVGLVGGLLGMVVGFVGGLLYASATMVLHAKIHARWPIVSMILGGVESLLILALGVVALRCMAMCLRLWFR